jgi:hypothetical protein
VEVLIEGSDLYGLEVPRRKRLGLANRIHDDLLFRRIGGTVLLSGFPRFFFSDGKRLTVSAVRKGESPQKTDDFVGALIPSARVP